MTRIEDSELFINSRGAVYHLDALPGEIAHTIILVGDRDRVKEISKYFDRIEVKCKHREFITHTGYIGRKRISVVATGIGPDNIDIVMNELDAVVNIDLETRTIKPQLTPLNIIRFGTSGSLQADIPVNSFVVSTHGLGIDNLLNFYCSENNDEEKSILQQFIAHTQLNSQVSQPYISTASASVIKHFVEGFQHGITVTCPGFFGPQGRVLRLGLTNPELINRLTYFRLGNHRITNFEMETSAIYGLGKLLGHHCLSINVIITNRLTKKFTENIHESVEKLIQQALPILENI